MANEAPVDGRVHHILWLVHLGLMYSRYTKEHPNRTKSPLETRSSPLDTKHPTLACKEGGANNRGHSSNATEVSSTSRENIASFPGQTTHNLLLTDIVVQQYKHCNCDICCAFSSSINIVAKRSFPY